MIWVYVVFMIDNIIILYPWSCHIILQIRILFVSSDFFLWWFLVVGFARFAIWHSQVGRWEWRTKLGQTESWGSQLTKKHKQNRVVEVVVCWTTSTILSLLPGSFNYYYLNLLIELIIIHHINNFDVLNHIIWLDHSFIDSFIHFLLPSSTHILVLHREKRERESRNYFLYVLIIIIIIIWSTSSHSSCTFSTLQSLVSK